MCFVPSYVLIYTNDSPDSIHSTCKIFAYEASLFSHVSDKYTSQSKLNNNLQAISNWISQWSMQFIPDPSKEVQKV